MLIYTYDLHIMMMNLLVIIDYIIFFQNTDDDDDDGVENDHDNARLTYDDDDVNLCEIY